MDLRINPYQTPSVVSEPGPEPVRDGVVVHIRGVRLYAGLVLFFIGLCLLAEVGMIVAAVALPDWFSGADATPGFHQTEFAEGAILLLRILYFFWFLIWMFRSAANANLLDGGLSGISPGMAVCSFFIPFYNLWGPYQAMGRISAVFTRISNRSVIWREVWWILWILPGFARILEMTGGMPGAGWMAVVLFLCSLVATAALVIQLTALQTSLYRNPPVISRFDRGLRGETHEPGIPNGMPLPHPKRRHVPRVPPPLAGRRPQLARMENPAAPFDPPSAGSGMGENPDGPG